MASEEYFFARPGSLRSLARLGWRIENFKALEYADVDLQPVTILAGANSSGKSSFLQSILLLAQSEVENTVALNGPLVTLGEVRDVIRDGQSHVAFGLEFGFRRSDTGSLPAQALGVEVGLADVSGSLEPVALTLTVNGEPWAGGVVDRRAKALLQREFLGGLADGSSVINLRPFAKTVSRPAYAVIEGLRPVALAYRRTLREERLRVRGLLAAAPNPQATAQQLWLGVHGQGRLFDPESAALTGLYEEPSYAPLPDWLGEDAPRLSSDDLTTRLLADWPSARGIEIVPLDPLSGSRLSGRIHRRYLAETTDWIGEATQRLRTSTRLTLDVARRVRYLGPLRDEPRVVYGLGRGTGPTPVGSRGEFTADLLVRRQRQVVQYVRPPEDEEPRAATLLEAVSDWTRYLGLGGSVRVEDRGKLGRTIAIDVAGVERDLTTVGVGVSQLLPVVVLLLSVPSDSIVLLEQPELHLHPAVQSRLGDFFALARPDVRIVVETHSEYLVTRLRRRVVDRRLDGEACSIIFSEMKDGVGTLRRLRVGPLGNLSEWPPGFFDESEQEAARIVEATASRLKKPDASAP